MGGDHILIQLLQEKLKLNFIILSFNNLDNNCSVNNLTQRDLYDKNIIIYFEDNIHFQLIGYFNGNIMKTLFENHEIPKIINDLI